MEAAVAFAALGQTSRLAVLKALHKHDGGLAVGKLARLLGIRQNTLSSHLKVLAQNDLVIGHRLGREMIYRLSPRMVERLVRYLQTAVGLKP